MQETKKCAKCKNLLPRYMFSPDKRQKDKLHCYCKQCRTIYARTKIKILGGGQRNLYKILHPETYKIAMLKHCRTRSRATPSDKAHSKLYSKIHSGEIIPETKCKICGGDFKVQAHHPDYNKPFDVIWVCLDCHASIHAELRRKRWMSENKNAS